VDVDDRCEGSLEGGGKRMLPSNFTRTSTQKHYLRQKMHERSLKTIGPADYDMEPILGNEAPTQYKAGPRYTMPRGATHRAALLKLKSSSLESLQRAHESRLITIDTQSTNKSPAKCFHGSRPAYPGVGEYSIEEATISVRNKSPTATIGKSKGRRWFEPNSLSKYRSYLPHNGFETKQASKAKLGTMAGQVRWSKSKKTPGVGDYDITRFKSLGKADATMFTAGPAGQSSVSLLPSRGQLVAGAYTALVQTRVKSASAFRGRRHTQPKPPHAAQGNE
jgi:hypothetical protein